MRPELANLIRLQGIDLEIRKINSEKTAVPERLAALKERLSSKKTQLNDLNDRLTEIQRRKIEVEDEFELENVRLNKSKKKTSAVKTNRELYALQKEIDEIKKANSSRENEILFAMEETSAIEEEIKTTKGEIKQANKEMKAEEKRVRKLEAKLDEKIVILSKDVEAMTKEIRPDLLSKYLFLKDRRAGVAIAAVTDGVCTACNMNIPPQLYNELLRDERIFTCPSCQRLIYALKVEA